MLYGSLFRRLDLYLMGVRTLLLSFLQIYLGLSQELLYKISLLFFKLMCGRETSLLVDNLKSISQLWLLIIEIYCAGWTYFYGQVTSIREQY